MFSPKMLQLSLLAKGIEELVILRPCLRSFATTSSEPFQKLYVSKNNEDFIAYRKHVPMNPSKDTGVIFCQGLMSNMCGVKARFLESYCKEKELNYVCFDYMGHGQSSGKFEDFTLSLWKENTLDVLAKVAEGPSIVVGSSIGSWVMLLATLENPSKVQGLVGIASAPDLLYERYKSLPDREKYGIKHAGYFSLPTDYANKAYQLPFNIITDCEKNLVLNKPEVDYDGRVHLIHGMNDETVPYSLSLKLSQKLRTSNVFVHLIKGGDHQLSRNRDLRFLATILDKMIFE